MGGFAENYYIYVTGSVVLMYFSEKMYRCEEQFMPFVGDRHLAQLNKGCIQIWRICRQP